MVSPDENVVDILDGGASLIRELADGPILIKSGQGTEVLLGD